jgi:hypothetical protein
MGDLPVDNRRALEIKEAKDEENRQRLYLLEGKPPQFWQIEDYVFLASHGFEKWNALVPKSHDKPIKFNEQTFNHGFANFHFPNGVTFDGAKLAVPDFNGAVFGGAVDDDIDGEEDGNAYPKFNEKNKSKVVARFIGTRFFECPKFKEIELNNTELVLEDVKVPENEALYLTPLLVRGKGTSQVLFRRNQFSSFSLYLGVPYTCEGQTDNGCLSITFQGNSFLGLGHIFIGALGKEAFHLNSIDFKENKFGNYGVNICLKNGNLNSLELNKNKFENLDFKVSEVAKIREIAIKNTVIDSGTVSLVGPTGVNNAFQFNDNEVRARLEISKFDVNSAERIEFMENKFSQKMCILAKCIFRKSLIFKGSVFEGPLDFEGSTFHDVPDLRSTKLDAHFSLDGIEIKHQKSVKDSLLSYKYRRLRELALAAQDHEQELALFANELTTKVVKKREFTFGISRFLYRYSSNFGRSLGLPIFWLFSAWFVTALTLLSQVKALTEDNWCEKLKLCIKVAGANLIPFVAATKQIFDKSYKALFPCKETGWIVDLVLVAQGFLGIVLIFLVALAFKNMFRIR